MLRTNHGELLDLFFARLLPSGTGDFDTGPSQLREKQTNPIMIDTLSFDGVFFLIYMNCVHRYTDGCRDGCLGLILTRSCIWIAR